MSDLSSKILGITIKNPIVIASSPLSESFESIISCANAGAGAIIAKSCSSHREPANGFRRCKIDNFGWWAASAFNREIQDVIYACKYLTKVCKQVNIPIFASVSEMSLNPAEWIQTCKLVQKAGVAGIQLDLFYFENAITSQTFSDDFVALLSVLKQEIDIPIFPKLNVNLPTKLIQQILKKAEINDVSLLDSVSVPAPFDIANHGMTTMRNSNDIHMASLFGSWQFPLTMKYLHEMKSSGFSVCAGGGVQTINDIIRLLMLGADSVQIATAPIINGIEIITRFITELEVFTKSMGFSKLSDYIGIATSNKETPTYLSQKANYHDSQCIFCKKCVLQRFCDAISEIDGNIFISHDRCEGCGLCAELCPTGAIRLA